jgi:hypothetical protein
LIDALVWLAVRYVVLVVLAVVACGESARCPGSASPTCASVLVQSLGEAEPGVLVVTHLVDGTIIDRATTDTSGRASLVSKSGALVSAVFPGSSSEGGTAVLTTTASPTYEVIMNGGTAMGANDPIIGQVEVTTDPADPPPTNNTTYTYDLGCSPNGTCDSGPLTFPGPVDVPASALESGQTIDIVVMYQQTTQDPDGGTSVSSYRPWQVVLRSRHDYPTRSESRLVRSAGGRGR